MKTNQDYKNAALAALKGKWAPAVLCAVVFVVIAGASSATTTTSDPNSFVFWKFAGLSLFSLLVVYPLEIGYYNAHRALLNEGDDQLLQNTFKMGFKNWVHNVFGMFLMMIFVCLWSLLFIVPGIIKAFAYALTPYILVDKPELSANQAIDLSKAMMKGHKFDLFWLSLSFIGWMILCIPTLGLGLFWLLPYMTTATAAFYEDVKAEYEAKNANV